MKSEPRYSVCKMSKMGYKNHLSDPKKKTKQTIRRRLGNGPEVEMSIILNAVIES